METIRVRLFARFRDVFGSEVLEVDFPISGTIHDLRLRLAESKPELAALLSRSQIAVNNEIASGDTIIHSGDEIALIPPVSGG